MALLEITVRDTDSRVLRTFVSGCIPADGELDLSEAGPWHILRRRELLQDGQWTLDITVATGAPPWNEPTTARRSSDHLLIVGATGRGS
jgi:hypothetical protein